MSGNHQTNMAARYIGVTRTALKGEKLFKTTFFFSLWSTTFKFVWLLLMKRCFYPGVAPDVTRRWFIGHFPTSCNCARLLHVCPAVFQVSSETGSQSSQRTVGKEEPEEPQYYSKKKAMNPMVKVGYAWWVNRRLFSDVNETLQFSLFEPKGC